MKKKVKSVPCLCAIFKKRKVAEPINVRGWPRRAIRAGSNGCSSVLYASLKRLSARNAISQPLASELSAMRPPTKSYASWRSVLTVFQKKPALCEMSARKESSIPAEMSVV